jgi:SPP1 family predicted phage head-tail adaptor
MKDIQSLKKAPLGRCRQLLTLEQTVDQESEIGGASRTYTPLAQVWACVQPMRATYDFVAQRVEAQVTHLIQLRWRTDMVTSMRFLLGQRIFLIHAIVDPEERQKTLICFCEEVV